MQLADIMVPDWIREISEERQRKAAEDHQTVLYSALSEALAQSQGPALAKNIFKELAIQTLACETIGVRATMAGVSRKNEEATPAEQVFRIEVSANSPWPRTTYLDISYREGEACLRGCPRDGEPLKIQFLPNEHGKLVMCSGHSPLPTPEDAASFILKPLVRAVLSHR